MKAIPSAPGYVACMEGHIWRNGTKRKPICNGRGYLRIKLSVNNHQRDAYVHRLVCEAYHGPCPDGYECRHKDGIRANNRPDNLCWSTKAENEADKVAHGTRLIGSIAPWAKLTEDVVMECRRRARDGEQAKDLAREFGVNEGTLWGAITGAKWAHLPGALRPGDLRRKFTDEQVRYIRSAAASRTRQSLADEMGVARNTIDQIVNRLTYQHVP